MQIIVHGGAVGIPEVPEPRQAVLDDAARTGIEQSSPLDAVEAALNILEADERFNAGFGGSIQSDGVVRTDAGMMTDDRRIGAAAGMTGVRDAISVARLVLEETPHVCLAADRAVDFASAFGVETEVDLLSESVREEFDEANPPTDSVRTQLDWILDRFGSENRHDHDTIGAVARDGDDFAVGTSTGGRMFALAGRVGDVPQAGSGFYCSPAGGASATGAGEDIARTTLTRRAVQYLEAGHDAQTAADRAIEEFDELTGSAAGVIVLDHEGAGLAITGAEMQTSLAQD
ncbi:MAG: isoaspartyl peptidase/L-asparaginase [Halobacteriota archaeon]